MNYSEFIAASANLETFINENTLYATFCKFDTDNSGRITKENMKLIM